VYEMQGVMCAVRYGNEGSSSSVTDIDRYIMTRKSPDPIFTTYADGKHKYDYTGSSLHKVPCPWLVECTYDYQLTNALTTIN
jgi:hypothetical protein